MNQIVIELEKNSTNTKNCKQNQITHIPQRWKTWIETREREFPDLWISENPWAFETNEEEEDEEENRKNDELRKQKGEKHERAREREKQKMMEIQFIT